MSSPPPSLPSASTTRRCTSPVSRRIRPWRSASWRSAWRRANSRHTSASTLAPARVVSTLSTLFTSRQIRRIDSRRRKRRISLRNSASDRLFANGPDQDRDGFRSDRIRHGSILAAALGNGQRPRAALASRRARGQSAHPRTHGAAQTLDIIPASARNGRNGAFIPPHSIHPPLSRATGKCAVADYSGSAAKR